MKRLFFISLIPILLTLPTQALSAGYLNQISLIANTNDSAAVQIDKAEDYCCFSAKSKYNLTEGYNFTDITSTTVTFSFLTQSMGTDVIDIYAKTACGDSVHLCTVLVKIISDTLYYIPCHRFWNQTLCSQLLLTKESEVNAFKSHPEWGWAYEGIQFYVVTYGGISTY